MYLNKSFTFASSSQEQPVCSVWLQAGLTVSEQLISLQCLFQESKEQIPLPEMTRQSAGESEGKTQRQRSFCTLFPPPTLSFQIPHPDPVMYVMCEVEKYHTHLRI